MVQLKSTPGQFLRASGPLDESGDPNSTEDGERATQWTVTIQHASTPNTIDTKAFAVCE
jgi:hypothetical protein